MEYYKGKNLDELYDLISEISSDYMQPLTVKEIDKIHSALNVKTLPKKVDEFLFKAGKQFRPWDGMDYELIDYESNFINYADDVIDDDVLDERFRKYGFDYNDCLFFLSNGGNQYCFINKKDEDDDPIVYSIDSFTSFDQPTTPRLFSQLVIDSYNEMVAYTKKAEDPWIDDSRRTGVIKWIEESFPFKNTSKFTTKTDRYVRYSIKHNDEENCLKYFTPILKEMLTENSSVFVYSDKKLYVYVPKKDKTMDNKIGLDIYKDRVAIVDMNEEWGWFTIEDTVYVFGEAFIQKISENIDAFSLTEYTGGNI